MSDTSINVIIDKRENQGEGVAVLHLRPIEGQSLPQFTAGAHIDVRISDDLLRQYSLSNSFNDENIYRLGVLNDPNSRGGSVALFDNFKEGLEITISEPRNHFPLGDHDGTAILLAGGIGVTPILAMAYELRAQNRPFEIHYSVRTRSAGAFVEELEQEFPQQFKLYCDDEAPLNAMALFADRKDEPHIYTCGPTGFMDWIIGVAKEENYSSEQIHFEYFSADVDTVGDAIEVYCSDSDKTVMVGPDETIAKALSKAGIKVDVSCEQGVCGTCITDVLEGIPDHRDQFLTDEEKEDNDQMALCCSRAKGPKLVIEI